MGDIYFKSRFLYKKKRRKNFRPLIYILAGMFIGLFAVSYGSYMAANLEYWQIKNISVSGLETLEEDEVYVAIQESFDGYAFYFIPKSQFFFASASEVIFNLKNKFSKLGKVSVEKKFPDTLAVLVEERNVFAIYCVTDRGSATTSRILVPPHLETKQGSQCFYIDREGVLFEPSVVAAGAILPIIENDEDSEFVEGKSAVSLTIINFFEEANTALKDAVGVALNSLTASKDIPKDYMLGTNFGWFLIVPREVLPADWSANLKTIIDTKIKTRIGDLDYVDLRFGSKVFYKFKR